MLHIGRRPGASLQTILEENPDSESQGSMETVAETTTEQLPLTPFHGGAIFNVSIDSPRGKGKLKTTATAAIRQFKKVESWAILSTPTR